MQRSIRVWGFVLPALLLVSSVRPAGAWVRVGFGGPRVGVYLGPGPWWGYGGYYDVPDDPYSYPYAYSPYYYPYGDAPYGRPYTYALPGVAPTPQQTQTSADDSRHDLKFVDAQIKRARDRADYDYEDGDITRAERDKEFNRLVGIKKEARAEAKVNGGYITGDQESELIQLLRTGGTASGSYASSAPENSGQSLKKVNEEIGRVRALLEAKLKTGDITRAQYEGMRDYLTRTEKQVHSDAAANDGTLTPDQENTVLQQLQRASDSLAKNLIAN